MPWQLKTKIITTNTNTMASSHYSKVRSAQNKGVTFLFCLGHGLALELFLMFGWSQRFSCQH